MIQQILYGVCSKSLHGFGQDKASISFRQSVDFGQDKAMIFPLHYIVCSNGISPS